MEPYYPHKFLWWLENCKKKKKKKGKSAFFLMISFGAHTLKLKDHPHPLSPEMHL